MAPATTSTQTAEQSPILKLRSDVAANEKPVERSNLAEMTRGPNPLQGMRRPDAPSKRPVRRPR